MKCVRVELRPTQEKGSCIRIFSMEDGTDITDDCQDITLHCDATATLRILKRDEYDKHYIEPGYDFVAYEKAKVVSIKGEWRSR